MHLFTVRVCILHASGRLIIDLADYQAQYSALH